MTNSVDPDQTPHSAFPYLFENLNNSFLSPVEPASVAQLDARPIGDQESAGLTPAGSATFFRGD